MGREFSRGGPRGGGRGGPRGGFGGRGGGRGGGFQNRDQGPPQRVEEIGTFSHVAGNQIIVQATPGIQNVIITYRKRFLNSSDMSTLRTYSPSERLMRFWDQLTDTCFQSI